MLVFFPYKVRTFLEVEMGSIERYGCLPEAVPVGRPRMKGFDNGEESGVAAQGGEEPIGGLEREGSGEREEAGDGFEGSGEVGGQSEAG